MTSNPCDLPSWLILLPEFCTEQNQPHSVSEVGTPGRVEQQFSSHQHDQQLPEGAHFQRWRSTENQTTTILRKNKTKLQLQARHKQNL